MASLSPLSQSLGYPAAWLESVGYLAWPGATYTPPISGPSDDAMAAPAAAGGANETAAAAPSLGAASATDSAATTTATVTVSAHAAGALVLLAMLASCALTASYMRSGGGGGSGGNKGAYYAPVGEGTRAKGAKEVGVELPAYKHAPAQQQQQPLYQAQRALCAQGFAEIA
jgi:hypothetical protein